MPRAKKARLGKSTVRKNTALKLLKPKEVRPEYIERFWQEWQKPEKANKALVGNPFWGRKVWALTSNTLVTVRRFATETMAKKYVDNAQKIEKGVMAAKPKWFTLQPVQFIDRRGNHVLERVYPSTNCKEFLFKTMGGSRYFSVVKRRLKRKGIDLDKKEVLSEMKAVVLKAFNELSEITQETSFRIKNHFFDLDKSAVLFLDFDPKTKKVLFAIIDNENPRSIKEY